MRILLVAVLCAGRAWAIDDCVAGAKPVDLNNGASTKDYTGTVRCFDRDTKEETRSMSFSNGKLTGIEKRKWPGGKAMEMEYRDGKRNGAHRTYQDGKLVEVTHWVDDHELGEELSYSKTGKLIRKVDKREPDSASTFQYFDEAGRLTEAGCGLQYSRPAGLKDCRWPGPTPLVFFHPNGQKHEVIELREGLRQGVTTSFDREGVKDGEERYAQGTLEGLMIEFEKGTPRHSANYVAGVMAGDEIEFFKDGNKKKVTIWKGREAAKVTEYFQNGSKKSERVRDGEQVIESQFNDDGQLIDLARFVRNERSGPHERFLPDGGSLLRESYTEGKLQGRKQSYFDDGKAEEDSQWERGKVTARKRWDADGGLIEDEAFYEDGSRKKKKP